MEKNGQRFNEDFFSIERSFEASMKKRKDRYCNKTSYFYEFDLGFGLFSAIFSSFVYGIIFMKVAPKDITIFKTKDFQVCHNNLNNNSKKQ